jgi:hypothetical protein
MPSKAGTTAAADESTTGAGGGVIAVSKVENRLASPGSVVARRTRPPSDGAASCHTSCEEYFQIMKSKNII